MKLLNYKLTIFNKQFSLITLIWFAAALLTSLTQVLKGVAHNNNYLIFKEVFFHTIQQQNLYTHYPNEYQDTNHYGPFFSIIIAAFAILPNWLGMMLWCIANICILFYAINKLPISEQNKKLVLLIGLLELLTSLHNIQFNPMLTAWIILSYVLVKEKKDFWATMFIAAGFLVKLYGIVGLAFFLFSDNKLKFILSFVFWMLVFFALPMLLSSPQFIIQSYYDWYSSLTEKNSENAVSIMQGMTAMRVLQKVFKLENISNIIVIGSAGLVYILSLLRYKNFNQLQFQLTYLATLLIAVVIFSTSAESATFVIAMLGVGIWFIAQPNKNGWPLALLIFAIVFTSLSTTDAFPKSVKENFIRPYAIKALPCFIIWIVAAYQLLFKKPDNLSSPI